MRAFWRSAALALVVPVLACAQDLRVLDREPPPPTAPRDECMCEEPDLCAVDQCEDSSGIRQLAAGYRHVCRVNDGALECWGENRSSQLGMADTETRSSPRQVGDDRRWLRVAAAEEHTCAIESPGSLFCWGNNASGQLGLRDTAPHRLPMRVGNFDDYEAVFCGGDSSCALRAGGQLYCWGATGQLISGSGDVGTPEIVDEPIEVLPDAEFRQVSLGALHACAIRRDGALLCWGQNGDGQLGVNMTSSMAKQPTQLERMGWQQVSAGQHHTCAIRQGELYCWGRGDSGELGFETRRVIAPVRVGEQDDWRTVSAGVTHTCATKRNNQLYCWGRNGNGQLGQTPSEPIKAPTLVKPESRFSKVVTGSAHTCALETGQRMYCWGANDQGQLGLGDTNIHVMPTAVD
jgi:alpha-tubulin suppressor-like RCC1 family protein